MADKFRACSVPGCNGNAHGSRHGSKGYCSKHYQKFRAHGNPLGVRTEDGEPMRFYLNVALCHESDDCLLWPYSKDRGGYGCLYKDGRVQGTHRVLCIDAHGEPPTPEHEAAHSCGNSLCCNPKHLSWKTPLENSSDKLLHGTHNRGERSGKSKLTEEQVREIKSLKGQISGYRLSKKFGVRSGTIDAIFSGRSWGWLD